MRRVSNKPGWKTGMLRNGAIYNNGCSCLNFWCIKVQFENDKIIKAKGRLVDDNGNVHEEKNYKLRKELIGDWYEV
jgi:hypothetical protein